MQRPPAIIAIGKNYLDHANEMGGKLPEHLMVFTKNPASVVGDGDAIRIPAICRTNGPQVDWEGELAVVIGRDCKDVPVEFALEVVSGYAVANDISARWWQLKGSGGQFCRGKGFDTFCPMSVPVPASAVPDPQALRIETRVNGAVMQDAGTDAMVFGVARIISDLSQGTTIVAGTVILTGTPAGVGAGRTPPVFLKHGDVVEVSIPGVGSLRNPVIEE
ncbi:MAG: fumarylacetoacetate hydrolase family protein [Phycisphaerae bacterium]|nr:fumarylacetoacetate hydrolase family protein [Phycisphaerae bacterium]